MCADQVDASSCAPLSPEEFSNLLKACKLARDNAYCPYSKFSVGCSILTSSGAIHKGANVENVSYPNGWCAEISALAAASACSDRKLKAVAISTHSAEFILPCGRCRQAISEFVPQDEEAKLRIILINGKNEIRQTDFAALFASPFKSLKLEDIKRVQEHSWRN